MQAEQLDLGRSRKNVGLAFLGRSPAPLTLPLLAPALPQNGRWGYAPNHPTRLDGDNLNNYVAVPYSNTDPAVQVRHRRQLRRHSSRRAARCAVAKPLC